MAKDDKQERWEPPTKPASLALVDGYVRLGAAVVLRALVELDDKDLRKATDALLWFCDPASSAGLFCESVLPDSDPVQLLKRTRIKKVRNYKRKEHI